MKVFINNREYTAESNETIIELCDKVGIHIPRFCYHKHLSVVASCRMCLVDIEGVNHAQPACSTPLRENMKVFTHSNKTKIAQKNSMEFLLINHPLDCPICDQGGECELQDVSLEHGDDHSTYMQLKRVVIDKDISPLISTDMTRCIHCSRCVRFGEEISNVKELGLLNRGEDMKIDVVIEGEVTSELSGNMIDLCPVGALNNKPYRYKARTWDLKQHAGISPHDCLGSNIYYHTYNNKILRAVPMENEQINQTWLSDRDRFGYEGIYSKDRAFKPMISQDGKLIECENQILLDRLNHIIINAIKNHGTENIGCLISPQSTSEELYLFQKLFKSLGIVNIDHRTNERDFSYQDDYPIMPSLGININEINEFQNIFLIGVNIKSEFPILSIHLNNAVKDKTKIFSINFDMLDEDFPVFYKKIVNNKNILSLLSNNIEEINVQPNEKNLIIIGPTVSHLPNQSDVLSTINKFNESINARIGFLTDFCNNTSAWLLGNLPHRDICGKKSKIIGKNAYEMISEKLSTYILFNLEPEHDFWDSNIVESALKNSKCNIIFTSYITPMIEKYADMVIPISTFAECDGSYINIDGTFQSFSKIVEPKKDISSGWSILNNLLKYNSSDIYDIKSLRSEIKDLIKDIDIQNFKINFRNVKSKNQLEGNTFIVTRRNTYKTDSIVRRAESLNMTMQSKDNNIYISNNIANQFKNNSYVDFENNNIRYKTNEFTVKTDLPDNTIIFSTNDLNGKYTGPKSQNINIKI